MIIFGLNWWIILYCDVCTFKIEQNKSNNNKSIFHSAASVYKPLLIVVVLLCSCVHHPLTHSLCRLQILQILVQAVVENLSDSHGCGAGGLASKLKELLGRVTSRQTSDAQIWQQYAKLYGGGHSDNLQDNVKVGVGTGWGSKRSRSMDATMKSAWGPLNHTFRGPESVGSIH